MYDKESLEAIELCVESIKENGELPLGIDAKSLYTEITSATRFGRKERREFSIVSLAKKNGKTVRGFLEMKEERDNKGQENDVKDNKKDIKDEEKNVQEDMKEEKENKNKYENEEEMQDEEVKEEKEEEDKEEDSQKENDKEESQEEGKNDENNFKKNKFKEDLNMKYFTDKGINVNIIDKALRNSNVDLTPKQLLLFIGTLNLRSNQNQKFSSKEELKKETERIYNEIRQGNFEEVKGSEEYYMQVGAHIFNDMYNGKDPKNAGDIFAHAIVIEYIKEEQRMANQNENQRDEKFTERGA